MRARLEFATGFGRTNARCVALLILLGACRPAADERAADAGVDRRRADAAALRRALPSDGAAPDAPGRGAADRREPVSVFPAGPAKPSTTRPATVPAAPAGCTAPAALASEVKRFLKAVAGHASRSGGCTDGPGGWLVTLRDVRVCAVGDGAGEIWPVEVTYRVRADFEPGGIGPAARNFRTYATVHQATLRFLRASGGWMLEAPTSVPLPEGVRLYTPLDQPHQAVCYGRKPAFHAATVTAR